MTKREYFQKDEYVRVFIKFITRYYLELGIEEYYDLVVKKKVMGKGFEVFTTPLEDCQKPLFFIDFEGFYEIFKENLTKIDANFYTFADCYLLAFDKDVISEIENQILNNKIKH